MATTTQDPSDASSRTAKPRATSGFLRTVIVLLIIGAVGLAAFAATRLINFGPAERAAVMTHKVTKGDLMITVTEDGNVESASNTEIKCEVAGGSSILWIVEDGKEVQKGEKLIELDQSQLEDDINAQTITYEKARSASIQADKDFAVAKISVQEYVEGTFKKELQDAAAQITIAEENLRSSKNSLVHSERMFRRGYISSLELESQQFAVQRAQLELDSANTAREVLEKFTKVKTLEDLRSQVETAQARMESEKAALDLEDARLRRLKEQIAKCVILAPAPGMVVYANDQSRSRMGGSQTANVELGAAVRERQDLLKLPDLKAMQVKVAVHETKVDKLQRGMRARVKIQDREYLGTVTSVANQPEPTSWMSANVKEYATTVHIEGESTGLRPGMTAEVEILVAHLNSALLLPVAAVVDQSGKFYCWVETAGKPERRPLVLGLSDDKFVEIKDGVSEGESVLLNPRAVVAEARGGDEVIEEKSIDDRFGAGASEGIPTQTPQGGPRGGGPGAMGGRWGGGEGGEGGGGGNWGGGRGGEGGGGGGRGRGGGMGNLMDNDKDGDGKVSREEAPEAMQGFFDRLDSNGDGAIDQAELDEMRSRRGGAGGQRGGGGGRRGGPDGGGDS